MYYSSMVKILKWRKRKEATNDEFCIALNFILDVLDGRIMFYNFNLPEFCEYCIEAGHFYVGALILDDYLEQVDTLDKESHYCLHDAFCKAFVGKSFLPESPKNILTSLYKMPIKD